MSNFSFSFDSSFVESVSVNHLTSTVSFKFANNEKTYNYYNVDNSTIVGLVTTVIRNESVGEYYNRFLKGRYSHPLYKIADRYGCKLPDSLQFYTEHDIVVIDSVALHNNSHLLSFVLQDVTTTIIFKVVEQEDGSKVLKHHFVYL